MLSQYVNDSGFFGGLKVDKICKTQSKFSLQTHSLPPIPTMADIEPEGGHEVSRRDPDPTSLYDGLEALFGNDQDANTTAILQRSEASAMQCSSDSEDENTRRHNTNSEDENRDSSDNESEDEESETEEGETDYVDRHDWEHIRKIPDDRLRSFVMNIVDMSGYLEPQDVQIIKRIEGTYHHVVLLRVDDEFSIDNYVLKIPAIGTPNRWQDGDAHNIHAETKLMEYLHQHTKVPVPKVIASDECLSNSLGCPYILMRHLPGKPSWQLWFEDDDRNWNTVDKISEATETKCVNFLRSLAQVMAQLRDVEFDQIGTPSFIRGTHSGPHPAINKYLWTCPSKLTPELLASDAQVYSYGPFACSHEYMTRRLDEIWPLQVPATRMPWKDLEKIATGKLLDVLFSHPVIASSRQSGADADALETFVLRHPDLDFKNILVDEGGNVTGRIDWDGCLAVPRCVGYASLPDFLICDCQPRFNLKNSPHMSYQLDHYRRIYTDSMIDTGCPEARFTEKSAMYRAIEGVLQAGGDADDLVRKILLEVPSLRRTDLSQIKMYVGGDWPEAEVYLKNEIDKLLEPTVP